MAKGKSLAVATLIFIRNLTAKTNAPRVVDVYEFRGSHFYCGNFATFTASNFIYAQVILVESDGYKRPRN
jgi:hypothetical protein